MDDEAELVLVVKNAVDSCPIEGVSRLRGPFESIDEVRELGSIGAVARPLSKPV